MIADAKANKWIFFLFVFACLFYFFPVESGWMTQSPKPVIEYIFLHCFESQRTHIFDDSIAKTICLDNWFVVDEKPMRIRKENKKNCIMWFVGEIQQLKLFERANWQTKIQQAQHMMQNHIVLDANRPSVSLENRRIWILRLNTCIRRASNIAQSGRWPFGTTIFQILISFPPMTHNLFQFVIIGIPQNGIEFASRVPTSIKLYSYTKQATRTYTK